VFSAWDRPDAAAELLIGRRETLAPLFDIDTGLDVLAAQTKPTAAARELSRVHGDFEADSPTFYRPEGPVPTWERLKSAWRGLLAPAARSGIRPRDASFRKIVIPSAARDL